MKTPKSIAAAVMGFALASGGAFAQQEGLVNVDISNVANNIARNINVDVSQIPVTVQVPIGVAANVCGIAANVLGSQRGQNNPDCRAATTSNALDNLVQSQMKKNKQG